MTHETPKTECPECGAKTFGAAYTNDIWDTRWYNVCTVCKWQERGPKKSQETRTPDRQCDKCGMWVPQWSGFPIEAVCCHCTKDPDWQKKIDYTKPLFRMS